jgi:hypothetical protein
LSALVAVLVLSCVLNLLGAWAVWRCRRAVVVRFGELRRLRALTGGTCGCRVCFSLRRWSL